MLLLALACALAGDPESPASRVLAPDATMLAAASDTTPVGAPHGGALTLDRALALAGARHPSLRASRHRLEAARARVRDARRRPPASLAMDVENLGGDLGRSRIESTLQLEQPFEWGGDRPARVGQSLAQVTARAAESDAAGLAVREAAAERFLAAWEAQERALRLADASRMAADAVAAARERVREGAAPRVEVLRAEGFLALRSIEHREAVAASKRARRGLALLWGADSLAFDTLALPDPPEPAPLEASGLAARLASHPEHRIAAAEREAEGWRVREAEAARRPDPALSAGVRHLEEAGGVGFLVGVSLPLGAGSPGAIDAARSDQAAAEARLEETQGRLREAVLAAHEQAVTAWQSWDSIRARVRPAAAEALQLVLAGYRAGRHGSLDIQDTQRALVEVELSGIAAAAEAWRARVAFEAFGVPPAAPQNPGGER